MLNLYTANCIIVLRSLVVIINEVICGTLNNASCRMKTQLSL
jgi:hypothetical protein